MASLRVHAQLDSIMNRIDPAKWSAAVERKAIRLEDKLIARSEKLLRHLQRQEERIYTKLLTTKDSVVAKQKLAEVQDKYRRLKAGVTEPADFLPGTVRQYIPHLDTLKTAFKFLNQNT